MSLLCSYDFAWVMSAKIWNTNHVSDENSRKFTFEFSIICWYNGPPRFLFLSFGRKRGWRNNENWPQKRRVTSMTYWQKYIFHFLSSVVWLSTPGTLGNIYIYFPWLIKKGIPFHYFIQQKITFQYKKVDHVGAKI